MIQVKILVNGTVMVVISLARTPVPWGSTMYVAVEVPRPFDEALALCESVGFSLASIESAGERDFLNGYLAGYSSLSHFACAHLLCISHLEVYT